MRVIPKLVSIAALASGVLMATQPAAAQDARRVPTPSPIPRSTPKIFPPLTPTWPGWPQPRPPFPPNPRPPFPPSPQPPFPPSLDHDYAVYVRVGGFVGWRVYGTFETRHQAERVERWLELRGHPARVVRVPDRPRILGQ